MVGQIAGSVMLFGLAVLFFESFRNAAQVRPGFDPNKKMLVMDVAPAMKISAVSWCEQASERLGALAGVRAATYARRIPLSGSGGGLTVRVEMPGQAPLGVRLNNVAGNYFSVMGTRVLAGRGIDTKDRENSTPVVVLSQLLARQIFPGHNSLGEWISIDGKKRQVVGVAEDAPSESIHEDLAPSLYLPFAQAPSGEFTLLVETARDPATLAKTVRQELKKFDPGALVGILSPMITMRAYMRQALMIDQLMATVTTGLGIFGLLLTAAGLFGVIQYSVNRRTREIGLRMSLGAEPADITRLVVAESLRMAAFGVPIGLLLLGLVAWSVRSFVIGVTPVSPLMYTTSAAAAVVLALSAAWLPARRATRVDPMAALRAE